MSQRAARGGTIKKGWMVRREESEQVEVSGSTRRNYRPKIELFYFFLKIRKYINAMCTFAQ